MTTYTTWMRTIPASNYLKARGVDQSPKTLRNKRARSEGPRWVYFGNTPLTTAEWLDEYIQSALTDRPAHRGQRSQPEPERAVAV
jgi:hypothetical protein